MTSSRKESRPRLRIRRSQERGIVKRARETLKRWSAWQLAPSFSYGRLDYRSWQEYEVVGSECGLIGSGWMDQVERQSENWSEQDELVS
jgi:hypothetical protein